MSSKRRFWTTFSVRSLLVMITLVCCLLAWRTYWYERGTINDWVDAILEDVADHPIADNNGHLALSPCPGDYSQSAQIQLLMKATRWLPTSERRHCVLKIIAEQFPAEAHEFYLEVCRTTDHDLLRSNAMLLASLFRVERDIDFFEGYLDDPNPIIRSAAIDAIGVIHKPSFDLPASNDHFFGTVAFDCDPPINLCMIREELSDEPGRLYVGGDWITFGQKMSWTDDRDRVVPADVKEKIWQLLLSDPDSTVRSAAARANRNWVPEDFQLRIAEWCVWIIDNENPDLARSVVEEVPPFAFRVEDDDSMTARRSKSNMIATRPVIQISVDQPLVVDLSVSIEDGRPSFGYPQPDDLCLIENLWGESYGYSRGVNFVKPEGLNSGYPWLLPHQSSFRVDKSTNFGFRWQTLFASPDKLDWMQLEPVSEEKFQWWAPLRETNCSWISSRGDSERFIFYDGPTQLTSPVVAKYDKGVWEVEVTHFDLVELKPFRALALIEVSNGSPSVIMKTIQSNEYRIAFADEEVRVEGDEVEQRLLKCLEEFGLKDEEAKCMIECWRTYFLEAEGQRLLTIFGKQAYDELCPISVSPTPTELARVGIFLTELNPGTNISPFDGSVEQPGSRHTSERASSEASEKGN